MSSQQDHVLEYELAVWSLEALYKLQNSLSATLGSLLDAKEELMKQARDVSPSLSQKKDHGEHMKGHEKLNMLLGPGKSQCCTGENVPGVR